MHPRRRFCWFWRRRFRLLSDRWTTLAELEDFLYHPDDRGAR